ncbi:hypothetical protein BOX15_Mlig027560g1 [Macrostomum lignano]|uniref:STI1 domain-containing protein n=1 Tax=Macrostomum lignano TaxID=282301 RepID=A0A267GHS9_9PLAT|nr:hypothetical protein BOX15_Mlig027560g1 [Macrostomum lignano]
MSVAEGADVPPLEDMSHVFKQQPEAASQTEKVTTAKHFPAAARKTEPPQTAPEVAGAAASKKQSASSGFGGMRRGFLTAGPAKPAAASQKQQQQKQQPQAEDMPHIRSDPAAAARSLQLDDVQASLAEAASASAAAAPSGWLTEDLLARVESDEALLRGLANPRLSAALAKFQTNPRGAMEEYKDDTEVQEFLAKFSALLGEHFTQIADKQEQEQQQQQPPEDPEVAEVLSRPGVREALTNPDVQRWLSLLREDPDKAQGLLRQSRDVEFQRRIGCLWRMDSSGWPSSLSRCRSVE